MPSEATSSAFERHLRELEELAEEHPRDPKYTLALASFRAALEAFNLMTRGTLEGREIETEEGTFRVVKSLRIPEPVKVPEVKKRKRSPAAIS